jgi:hypothetical protein
VDKMLVRLNNERERKKEAREDKVSEREKKRELK